MLSFRSYPVVDFCEHGNEPSSFIKGGKFLTLWRTVSFSRRAVLNGRSNKCHTYVYYSTNTNKTKLLRTQPGPTAISWLPRGAQVYTPVFVCCGWLNTTPYICSPVLGLIVKQFQKERYFLLLRFLPAMTALQSVSHHPPLSCPFSHVCGTPISPRPQPFPYHSSAPSSELSDSLCLLCSISFSPLSSRNPAEITSDAQISPPVSPGGPRGLLWPRTVLLLGQSRGYQSAHVHNVAVNICRKSRDQTLNRAPRAD
jgi:hypothetical protein